MSGIRTGTRLEQLQDVRRQTGLQLEHAQRNGLPTGRLVELRDRLDDEIGAEGGRPPAPPTLPARPPIHGDLRTAELLARLGVTAKQVKQWAVDQGLIPAVVRGRVAHHHVQAYAEAHLEQHRSETTR